ncbi:MAG: tetratricopeptide repeat protein [Alphaproteobacteria bacterium]|nr:tetratricopeptide repeat protein [Alphaproteobacteria bacterium]
MLRWTRLLLFVLPLLAMIADAAAQAPEAASPAAQAERARRLNADATALQRQGRLAEAEAMFREALALRERLQPEGGAELAESLNNLGLLLRLRGQADAARLLLERALSLRRAAFGEDHPAVAVTLNNLAIARHELGEPGAALALHERALAIRSAAFGPDHPAVAQSLNNIAYIHRSEDRQNAAEPLYRRALDIWSRHDPDSLDTADGLDNLATLLQDQGRYSEARPMFERALAIREQLLGEKHGLVARSRNNLAHVYRHLGLHRLAEPLHRSSLRLGEELFGADSLAVAVAYNNLGLVLQDQGRLIEAEAAQQQALLIRERRSGPESADVAQSLNNLAFLLRLQGRADQAEVLFRRALAIRERIFGANHREVANSLHNLAEVLHEKGDQARARALYARALAMREAILGPAHPSVATTLNNLAIVLRAEGDLAEAEAHYQRALEINRASLGALHPETATNLANIADLLRAQARLPEALTLFGEALFVREQGLGSGHPEVARIHDALAETHLRMGRPDLALAQARRAVTILATRTELLLADRGMGAEAEWRSRRHYFHRLLSLLWQEAAKAGRLATSDLMDEAFRAAQLAGSLEVAGAVASMSARLADGSSELSERLRTVQDLRERRRLLDRDLFETAASGAANAGTRRGRLLEELRSIDADLRATTTSLALDFPGAGEAAALRPRGIAEIVARLAPDEVLLMWSSGRDETFLFAVSVERSHWWRIDAGRERIAGLVQALRSTLEPFPGMLASDVRPFDLVAAHQLYRLLFGQAETFLAPARRLLTVSDGALQSLPLAVLVRSMPASGQDHEAADWLVRHFALTTLPSASSLVSLRDVQPRRETGGPFVGFGDPLFSGGPGDLRGVTPSLLWRGGSVDLAAIRDFPRLPETERELLAQAAATGTGERRIFLRGEATERRARSGVLSDARIVSFATHGLVAGEIRGLGEPALVLTPPPAASPEDDGLLTMSEVAELRLDADWVVLSACNTAAPAIEEGAEGLSGLARAFFHAGARALLVSHWQVLSQAAVHLTTGTFEALASEPGIGRAEALRRSMLRLIDGRTGDRNQAPDMSHPLFWAPFILVGEGGPGR